MFLYTLPVCLLASMVVAQQGDGGTATGNIVQDGNIAGAAGRSTASVSLSTGATIAIAIVVSIVVILGILTAVLFFTAKKRQWTVRETLRRSTRRVTTGLKSAVAPLTPRAKTNFSRKETSGLRGQSPRRRQEKNVDVDMEALTGNGRNRDVEKGDTSRIMMTEKKGKPQMPSVNIPKGGYRPDETPKTPMFNKVFGRE